MSTDDPFAPIAAPPPGFSRDDAVRIAAERYGFEASAAVLISERDQNFLLSSEDGTRRVLKIANALEDPQVTAFQISALLHIEARSGGRVPAPRIVRTKSGQSSVRLPSAQGEHTVRMLSYVEGQRMQGTEVAGSTARSLGRRLAELDLALAGFSHPGQDQALLWDLKRAGGLRRLLQCVSVQRERDLLSATLDEFDAEVLPAMRSLPWQVIHNDANPANLLVDETRQTVVGIIDFGDMLRSPRIVEVAVAASYLRTTAGNPLLLIAECLGAYHSTSALARAEVDVLHALVKARLATTVLILRWRERLRGPDDAYLREALASEASALPFLERLAGIASADAARVYRQACASADTAWSAC